jgi:hypothetical protein
MKLITAIVKPETRGPWHTWESDPGCARGGPTYRAIRLRTANRRCAIHQPWLVY